MSGVSQTLDRIRATFDDDNLVANAGLLLPATLVERLGVETLINTTVRLNGRVGGATPGRKVLTLMNTMLAGGSHIDHADMLRAGASEQVVSHRVMAPSTLGTFLRSFTFGHVRQLEAVNDVARQRAWAAGVAPGPLTVDVDSTICEVVGKAKQGASYGYTHAGRLELDDPLSNHLPNAPAGADTTIRALLGHRSGIPSDTEHPGFFPDALEDLTRSWEPAEMLGYVFVCDIKGLFERFALNDLGQYR